MDSEEERSLRARGKQDILGGRTGAFSGWGPQRSEWGGPQVGKEVIRLDQCGLNRGFM